MGRGNSTFRTSVLAGIVMRSFAPSKAARRKGEGFVAGGGCVGCVDVSGKTLFRTDTASTRSEGNRGKGSVVSVMVRICFYHFHRSKAQRRAR